jgi:hypothetical protein
MIPQASRATKTNPQEGAAGVHFGALRVVDDAAHTVVLRNTGRYDVAFRFAVASQAVSDVMAIAPTEGALGPGKEASVVVGCGGFLSGCQPCRSDPRLDCGRKPGAVASLRLATRSSC